LAPLRPFKVNRRYAGGGNKSAPAGLTMRGENLNRQKPSVETVSPLNPEFRNHPQRVLDEIRSTCPILQDESSKVVILSRDEGGTDRIKAHCPGNWQTKVTPECLQSNGLSVSCLMTVW